MDKNKIKSKIQEQITSLNKKLESVSGDYPTNTPKRQREQKQRDKYKEQYRQRLELLNYLDNELNSRKLAPLETLLLTGTVYDSIKELAINHRYDTKNNAQISPAVFQSLDNSLQRALLKAGINDNESLHKGLTQFTEIVNLAVTPTDQDAMRLRDLVFAARNDQGGDIQFTPDSIAEYLITLAGITSESKVLEPEAGIASIADKIKEITPYVDCVEIVPRFREILGLKGHNIIGGDLFKLEKNAVYDAVIMNPPFSAEIEHIKYAFGFLKPGGSLVAVCSTRFSFMDKKGYPEFRTWLKENEFFYEDAEGKFEKTGTSSIVLKIMRHSEAA